MTETAPASEIHPDVLELAQKIADKTEELITQVETLDGNNWLSIADEIDNLNTQLQAMLIVPQPSRKTSKST